MTSNDDAQTFFESYRDSLLARDAQRIAAAYCCPALIAFPGHRIAVTSPAQTVEFFSAAVGQYTGVDTIDMAVSVVAATDHSIWADVTWDYRGTHPGERFIYQLLATEDGWGIGVLTPR